MDQDTQQMHYFTEVAELARVMGSAQRLLLLQHVAQGERPVERLAELSGLTLANTSQHLQHLKRASLVQARREGKNVFYSLGKGPIIELLAALSQMADFNHGEVRALINDSYNRKASLEGISQQELAQRIRDRSVVVLDVRPQEEFVSGHLPGAINIPYQELEGRLSELPQDSEIIAYCRGSRCILAPEAVTLLRAGGMQARFFPDGFPSWKAAGMVTERNA